MSGYYAYSHTARSNATTRPGDGRSEAYLPLPPANPSTLELPPFSSLTTQQSGFETYGYDPSVSNAVAGTYWDTKYSPLCNWYLPLE